MDIATQMVLFAKVVDAGGFSAAARDLGQTPSSVSRQIAHLEDRLSVRLLNRSTRGFSLTEEGRAFHARCADVARRVAEAEEEMASLGDHPQGTLRLAITAAFGKSQVMPVLPGFLERYPDLKLSIELTDRPVDLIAEGIDVAIRFSEQLADDDVVARKLAPIRRLVVASPDYVARHGRPETLDDLARHNCLTVYTVSQWNTWRFQTPDGPRSVTIQGNTEVNSADGLYTAAVSGIGLAWLSDYLVGPAIESGTLVHLLPEFSEAEEVAALYALYAARRNLSPKIRAFVDYLGEMYGRDKPWFGSG
jgi:DNA-binding transcriptional LysR family regulator